MVTLKQKAANSLPFTFPELIAINIQKLDIYITQEYIQFRCNSASDQYWRDTMKHVFKAISATKTAKMLRK